MHLPYTKFFYFLLLVVINHFYVLVVMWLYLSITRFLTIMGTPETIMVMLIVHKHTNIADLFLSKVLSNIFSLVYSLVDEILDEKLQTWKIVRCVLN